VILVFVGFFRIVGPRFRQVQQKLGMLNTVLQENLAGIRVVKAFAREPYELDRYSTANNDLLDEVLAVRRGIALSFPSIFLIANLGTMGIVWFGGWQVIGGTLSIGELVAFTTYLTFLVQPVLTLGFASSTIAQADASARRVFEVLDAPLEVTSKPDADHLPPLRGQVVFEDVSFRYQGSDLPSLDDVSFTVEPGQTVAILGRTGAGKSSIINLLPRFYDATEGRVLLDGYDVRDVTLSSLRRQIGIVLQDTTLFSGTIRENIAYGRPEASDEEIERVARAAQAHDFIHQLPNGYATLIGERGIGLSGGQRQRIAIARTLLLDPALLILDDSTSAVDAETEYYIQQALAPLLADRTSFVIAQRLSTIRQADLILLLDQGQLVNQGTYEYLRENCGTFCQLLDEQFQDEDRQELDVDRAA
jgi:ATP-binding cassette subfamily B protein